MRKTILSAIILLMAATMSQQSYARPIIADLSLRQIEIDSSFKGTEILLFGARNDAGDIVVTVRGPELSYIVRKKEKIAGIWANRRQVRFDDINGFYTVASNRPLSELNNDYLLASLNIGTDNLDLAIKGPPVLEAEEFKKALLAQQVKSQLFTPSVEEVSFIGDTLFRTIIKFPENIPRGTYTAEVYLFSDGQLIGVQSTPILVYKKGFDAFVYDFAYKNPATYGIIAVLIALFAGWVAGILFRRV